MSARIIPLGRQDVGTAGNRQTSRFRRLNLADGHRAALFGPAQPRSRVGEGEKDNRHFLLQHRLEVLGCSCDVLGEEAGAEGFIRL